MSDRRIRLLLSDGTTVVVNRKTAAGLTRLSRASVDLARGTTRSLAIVEVDAQGVIRPLIFTHDGAKLDVLGDALVKLGARATNMATLWEGNAPRANRSVTRN